jgi:hypothetical protein
MKKSELIAPEGNSAAQIFNSRGRTAGCIEGRQWRRDSRLFDVQVASQHDH